MNLSNKTNFIPVDSEHFSIWYALNRNLKSDNVKKIYLTASGGPLLKFSNKRMKKIRTKMFSNILLGKWEKK